MSNYEVVYNVSLLDDIHNYFPAVLYDNGRFQNLPQLFHYVRTQMNSRFNLYSYGASLAQARGAAPAAPMPQNYTNVIYTPQPAPATISPILPTISRTDVSRNLAGANALLELFNIGLADLTPPSGGTLGHLPADIWGSIGSFGDPVMVRPTPEVLARATETVPGSILAEGSRCAICQDNITATETTRRIRACHHAYHLVCIDQWFRRSVFCPTCRHDIRIPLTPLPEAPAAP